MNIAQAQQEIEKLRKQREEIYSQVSLLDNQINEWVEAIRETCEHPYQLTLVEEVGHEDEYGRFVEGWTTLSIECSICKTHRIVSKRRFRESDLSYSDVLKMSASEIEDVLR